MLYSNILSILTARCCIRTILSFMRLRRVKGLEKKSFFWYFYDYLYCVKISKIQIIACNNPDCWIFATIQIIVFNNPDYWYFSSNIYVDNSIILNCWYLTNWLLRNLKNLDLLLKWKKFITIYTWSASR